MSRHRNVKHLIEEDYDYYEDDDYGYDDDYDDGYVQPPKQKQQQQKQQKQQSKQQQQQQKNVGKKSGGAAVATPKKQQQQQQQQQQSTIKNKKQQQSTTTVSTPPRPPTTTASNNKSTQKQSQQQQQQSSSSAAKASTTTPSSSGKKPIKDPPPLPNILIDKENYTKKKKKVPLTIVCIGHVDAGKSTITGHLLYGNDGNTKGRRNSSGGNNNNRSINYAWLLDEDEKEREHGVTMDIATKKFAATELLTNFDIVLQDAPGHADYVPAMITGTSSADAALLTVDITDINIINSGKGQLREHVYLARGLGVNQILILLNKMDVIGWDNYETYYTVEKQIKDFLINKVGYPTQRVRCIPISGLTGVNIFNNNNNNVDEDTKTLRSWYTGPTLIDAIDTFVPPKQQQQKLLLEKPFRMVISDVLDGSGGNKNVSIRGKVVSGWIKQGETISVLPSGDESIITKFNSLHNNNEEQEGIEVSNNNNNNNDKQQQQVIQERKLYCIVGELLDCIISNIDIHRISIGNIITRPTSKVILSNKCRTKIFILDTLTIPLIRGTQIILHMHYIDIPGYISILHRTINTTTNETLKERPRALTKGITAIVDIQLNIPICMETFTNCRALGRFILRRSGDSIAVGRIEQVLL